MTAGYTATMGVLFAVLALATYAAMASALMDELDTGLRARVAAIQGAVQTAPPDPADPAARLTGVDLGGPSSRLVEPTEAFTQVLSRDGTVLTHSRDLAGPALPPGVAGRITRAQLFVHHLPGVPGATRILALPVRRGGSELVIVAGASMSDRDDSLDQLRLLFLVGGPAALALAALAGWLVAGRALGPVDRMRHQAATITATGLGQRLTVPPARDELNRLATTLNAMLSRLEEAQHRDQRFMDHASHELRTPLSILRAELDLALARPRARQELLAALQSAHEETARLCRLAEDLLVLSRAQGGHLPLRRTPTPLGEPLHQAARHFARRAASHQIRLQVDAPATPVPMDGTRIRQAVENLIDNALRYAPSGSTVTIQGRIIAGTIRISVHDTGPGLPAETAAHAFEPFARTDPQAPAPNDTRTPDGTGLGLSIVRAIADAHGGTTTLDTHPASGAQITLTLPHHQ